MVRSGPTSSRKTYFTLGYFFAIRWPARSWAPDQVVPLITLKCRIASVAFAAAAEADEPYPPPEPARSATSTSAGMAIRNGANLVRHRSAQFMSASPPSLLKWVSLVVLLDFPGSIRRCATVLQPARFSLSPFEERLRRGPWAKNVQGRAPCIKKPPFVKKPSDFDEAPRRRSCLG